MKQKYEVIVKNIFLYLYYATCYLEQENKNTDKNKNKCNGSGTCPREFINAACLQFVALLKILLRKTGQ